MWIINLKDFDLAKTKEITKISDLVPDANNYNKGTEFGSGLIAKSIQKNGLGRSLLLDKHGKVIAGNKTLEGTVAAGFNDEDIIVVKTDGTKLVVVQRTDLDLDTRKGKEMALADNATSKANLAWDYEALSTDFESVELEAWGVFADNQSDEDYSDKNKEVDVDGLESLMTISLKYEADEYWKIKEQLSKIAATPEQAVWKLLGNE